MLFCRRIKDQSNSLNSVRFCNISMRLGDHAPFLDSRKFFFFSILFRAAFNAAYSVRLGRSAKTKSRWYLIYGVYARGSKISHQSALELCNLSLTPHSSLEKDNSLLVTPHIHLSIVISLTSSCAILYSRCCPGLSTIQQSWSDRHSAVNLPLQRH